MAKVNKSRGRKTRKEKLESLKVTLEKKYEDRKKINAEIKQISDQIEELEQYFMLQEISNFKETLSKKGISLKEITEAVEGGLFDNIKED